MKKANPTLIGTFVIVGVALVIGAVLLFSSPDLFSTKDRYSIYFRQNVNGLKIGAPVKFLGIEMGSVIEIDGLYDRETGSVTPRVVIEVIRDILTNEEVQSLDEQLAVLDLMVIRGARAKLQSQSILTGQLYVSVEFHPDTEVRYLARKDEPYPELPSLDSGLEEAIASLQSVLENADKAMATIQQLLTSDDFRDGVSRMDDVVAKVDSLVGTVNQFFADANVYVTGDLSDATVSLKQTLDTTREDIHMLSGKISEETLVDLNQVLTEIQALVDQVSLRIGKEDPLNFEVIKTLRDLQSAARTVKALAAYLDEHPEALLKGKNTQ